MSFFYATANATQVISGSTDTTMVFGSEVSDPDSVFASDLFTVPSGWNGRVGGLFAGHAFTGNLTGQNNLRIQRQVGGSGGFSDVAGFTGDESFGISVAVLPIVFATGDVYRVSFNGAAHTKPATVNNYFSGFVMPSAPTEVGMFKAEVTSGNSGNSLVVPTLGTEVIDSHSAFASSVFTVPSDLNGGFLILQAAVDKASTNNGSTVEIQRSTDSGASWTTIAQNRSCRRTVARGECAGIVVPAVTGDQYRMAFTDYVYLGLGATIATGTLSHFSGLLIK